MVGWNENKSVFVAFNTLSSFPDMSVARYCKAQRKSVKFDQPEMMIITIINVTNTLATIASP